jgi:4-amino-4-deoxy-L-arabinose transferase-like glycosyltransferase
MQASPSFDRWTGRGNPSTWAGVVLLSLLRLAHVHLLWADEDFHIAAALNILHGRVPYRDFLYDKPPLSAFYYLLTGAHAGWPLRLLDAAYVLLACCLMYRLARDWWGESAGRTAALLFAFFMAFYLPSAVISFAPDALMIVPHVAAIYFTHQRRGGWAGLCAGIAFLVNTKAIFVLATCGLWLAIPISTEKFWSKGAKQWLALTVGFTIPLAAAFVALLGVGAWHGYVQQVWQWGLQYAKQPPALDPFRAGLALTANWLGFHAALVLAAAFALLRMRTVDRLKLSLWLALSFMAVSLGGRFSPRYFLQLLPPLVLVAAEGCTLLWQTYRLRVAAALAILLLIPLCRFGPRYAMLAFDNLRGREPQWADVAMELDNQRAAGRITTLAHPGDTLFVWGLRSSIYVYTRMISDSRFWDSEPLTGVPGDRHLAAATVIDSGPAAAYRAELTLSRPTFIVDGLGPMNPRLAPGVYPELRPWLSEYRLVGRTGLTLIYRRR